MTYVPVFREAATPQQYADRYNSVRLDNDTLDSSPFPITLALSEEMWGTVEGLLAGSGIPNLDSPAPVVPGAFSDEKCRRVAQLVAALMHCEVVLPDGRQVTLYTRDVPHHVPIPPLMLIAISASRLQRQVTIGVERSLPLSSAHGNSEFRLALLYHTPGVHAVGETFKRAAGRRSYAC